MTPFPFALSARRSFLTKKSVSKGIPTFPYLTDAIKNSRLTNKINHIFKKENRMKNRVIVATGLCIMLLSNSCQAGDKNISASSTKKENTQTTQSLATTNTDGKTSGNTATVVKRNETPKPQQFSAADILGDANLSVDATIAFVDSFAIMGECEEGQKARKEIEAKRDLATQELQDQSKKFEKAKSDYVAQSTMMNDSAREKKEKELIKMERDLKNLVAEKEEELKLDMQIATETLAQGLEAGVAKLAQNENLDVIFDKMTGRAIYVSDKFNFTKKAIDAVNDVYAVKVAQNTKHIEAPAATKVAENKAVAAPKSAKASA